MVKGKRSCCRWPTPAYFIFIRWPWGFSTPTSAGLVHRDIKPSQPDAGSRRGGQGHRQGAGLRPGQGDPRGPGRRRPDPPGPDALGTPDFIAPEQILDAPGADIRADIYSLGGTLFFLLAGRPPFKANSLYDIYQAHISREIDPLNLIRPEVPAELAALVGKMMAKDPKRRFQTPTEVAEALKPFFKKTAERPKPEIDRSEASIAPAPPSQLPELVSPIADAVPERSISEVKDRIEPEEMPVEPAEPPRRRPPWVRASVAAGVLLFGIAALVAGIVRVRTARGDLVFADLPDQAVVTVDGEAATVDWSGGKESAKVSIAPGGHKVRVAWKGVEILGEEVKIASGEAKPIRIWLEPGVGGAEIPPDLVRAGTVWTSEDEVRTLTILDREGEFFSAIMTDSEKLRKVEGTIKGTRMVMLRRDMTIFVGPAGADHEAEVIGDEISDNWVLGDGNTGQWKFRLKKKPEAASTGVDAFRSGSVWFVRDTGTTLTVLDRDGGHFRAITAEPSRVREIAGTIDGGRISWRGADVKVLFGPPAPDFDGEIHGDSISLAWHLPDGTVGGRDEALLKRPAGQLVQAGSVWALEDSDGVMTILERVGDRFKAMCVLGDLVREFNGTIRGSRIAWRAADGKVIAGPPGLDNDGEVLGEEIAITRYRDDGSVDGHAQVRLKRPAPSASAKAGDPFQPGSVWIPEDGDGSFTVLDRDGESFRALNAYSEIVREIRGTIREGRFFYDGAGIRGISGPPPGGGGGIRGDVKGEEFSTTWLGTDGSRIAGKTFHLKKPAGGKVGSNPPGSLFNGRDLDGWTPYATGRPIDLKTIARVEDGEIVLSRLAMQAGVVSDQSYRDFTLDLEYRFEAGAKITPWGGKICIWPDPAAGFRGEVQCQILPGQAGDLYSIAADRRLSGEGFRHQGRFHRIDRRLDAESPVGEWNAVSIRCEGNRIAFTINGRVVSEAESDRPVAGRIFLMTQGCEIRFRNVVVTDLH